MDYGSKRIVPGFMDIHCHGACPSSTPTTQSRRACATGQSISSLRVSTSFLATTVTQSVEVLTNAVANVADVMEGSYEGAEDPGASTLKAPTSI